MVRKRYSEYDYIDPHNIYTYPDSDVLINKENITSPEEAQQNEHLLVNRRLIDLYLKPIPVFKVSDIRLIHQYLFQDIYDWTGDYRKVNISKNNNPFMPIQSFSSTETYINSLLKDYHQSSNDKNIIIKQLAQILDNLNYFHPFREGNGRTQREVIRSLALSKGYNVQIRVEQDDTIYNTYMDGTVKGDTHILEQLFRYILNDQDLS